MRIKFCLTVVTYSLFTLAGPVAQAEDVTIVQMNKKFSQDEIVIKKGTTVTFKNDDPFTHNVYSESPDIAFDLKTQTPGSSSPVKFDKVGEGLVECAIHPSMKLKVHVTP